MLWSEQIDGHHTQLLFQNSFQAPSKASLPVFDSASAFLDGTFVFQP